MRNLFFLFIALSVVCCTRRVIPAERKKITCSDSLLLEKYKHKIMLSYADDSTLTNAQLDTLWLKDYGENMSFQNCVVKYAPDRKFKIVTIELESCGAYCNSEWFSWILYKNGKSEIAREAPFYNVDTIIKLPDSNYLVIDEYGARPASVYTIFCKTAHLISFSDTLIVHKIKYKKEDYFSFCQENSVELKDESQPYIKYENGFLKYYYGNNYAYSNGMDIDTIRKGQFKYAGGKFVFDKEEIKVRK